MTTKIDGLSETVLHEWHIAHHATMGEFGGFHMPLWYNILLPGLAPPLTEHMAVRKFAGFFDISHMGRLKITGKDSPAFLRFLLTNDVEALNDFGADHGMAQYTFISNEEGRAIDDAYVYRTGASEFTLVVNAANRTKDSAWIQKILEENRKRFQDVRIEDISEQIAMFSLQGPNSQLVLENLLSVDGNKGNLPQPKKNYLSIARIEESEVMIARTGYTGESLGFELFVPANKAVSIWEKTLAIGTSYNILPAGLAARDSTRLEAGLPLYGHEQGDGSYGNPNLPIFSIPQAAFGVNLLSSDRDFIGRPALELQRKAYEAIQRGEVTNFSQIQAVPRLVRPLLVAEGGRKLTPNTKIYLNDMEVGKITSGLRVPFTYFEGEGITSKPGEKWGTRSIALALVDGNVIYDPNKDTYFQIEDNTGRKLDWPMAKLVDTNMLPLVPYSRPQFGAFLKPKRVEPYQGTIAEFAEALTEDGVVNTRWNREKTLRRIASECHVSELVAALTLLDESGQYNEHALIRALGIELPYYSGKEFMNQGIEGGRLKAGIEELLNAELRKRYNAENVLHEPTSGQTANLLTWGSIMDWFNRHRAGDMQRLTHVLTIGLNYGLHISAMPGYGMKDYVRRDSTGRPAVSHFPMRRDNPYMIDIEATESLLDMIDPRSNLLQLIVLGRSMILYPEPVADLRRIVDTKYGKENPNKPFIVVDDSHTSGLEPDFQDPLAEGADIGTGSFHKTEFGMHRGKVVTNLNYEHPKWQMFLARKFTYFSSTHLNTMVAMLMAAREGNEYGSAFRKQVMKNSTAYAKALHHALVNTGFHVEGDPQLGYTKSHQLILRTPRYKAHEAVQKLRDNNIITSPTALPDDLSFMGPSGIRVGVQAGTRRLMKEEHFGEEADLVARALRGQNVRNQVIDFAGQFKGLGYCLPEEISRPLVERIYALRA